MWKNGNCKFCLNKGKCTSWKDCNWELSPTPPNKMAKLLEIESDLRKLDWSNSQESTITVILLEKKMEELQVWYRLFP
jgi:hypothetical protein